MLSEEDWIAHFDHVHVVTAFFKSFIFLRLRFAFITQVLVAVLFSEEALIELTAFTCSISVYAFKPT